jgi:RimJ/RimL family protein N-acetyltransferase
LRAPASTPEEAVGGGATLGAVIETERLLLRLPGAGDSEAVARAMADEEVMRFIGLGTTTSFAESSAHVDWMQRAWREDGFGAFIVARKSDEETVGHVGLFAWDPAEWRPGIRAEIGDRAEIELGWMLSRDAWGCGYASEAAAGVRDWALREVRPRRLISLIHPENVRSTRVATKIGEHRETTVTTYLGVPTDLWTF